MAMVRARSNLEILQVHRRFRHVIPPVCVPLYHLLREIQRQAGGQRRRLVDIHLGGVSIGHQPKPLRRRRLATLRQALRQADECHITLAGVEVGQQAAEAFAVGDKAGAQVSLIYVGAQELRVRKAHHVIGLGQSWNGVV
jgi:hypothetical protein